MTRLAAPVVALAVLAACGQPQPTTVHARQPTRTPADPTAGVDQAMWNATTTTAPPRTTTTLRPSRTRAQQAPPTTIVVAPRGDIEQAICAAFGDQCAKAIAVARCESGLRPNAVNGNHRGLFQISIYWHAARIRRLGYSLDDMLSAGPNIAVARNIQLEQGWRPWTCA